MVAASPRRSTILQAMLAEARSGKISVLALPATVEPGAFDRPTAGARAAFGVFPCVPPLASEPKLGLTLYNTATIRCGPETGPRW